MRQPGSDCTEWETGVGIQLLKYVGARSVNVHEVQQKEERENEKFVRAQSLAKRLKPPHVST